jgi:Na+/H+-dicarboxylate symporter
MMKRLLKMGLLPRILIAIVLGIVFGQILGESLIRLFVTFNALFSQLLGFLIPLIIMGLITSAIGEIGRQAGRLLLMTVAIAYMDTVFCGLLSYTTGQMLFPSMLGQTMASALPETVQALEPYFKLQIPPMLDIMSALVFSFILGICIAYGNLPTLRHIAIEFKEVVFKTISYLIIPLLPLYIFGIFLTMTYSGQVWSIMSIFARVIVVIIVLHLFILLYQFLLAGVVSHRNPFRLLWNMLPAYMTALGTSSSAATIPVTLRQTLKNGVSEGIAGFVVPLCATIHMSGSVMKITLCALAICLLNGMPSELGLFVQFILMLCVVMVAAPGVPGGSIMAALAPLASILGFDSEQQALMIALYIALDSFGTACNVTGDGAIAIVVDKFRRK